MSAADFIEWMGVLIAAPLGTLMLFFQIVTALYVNFDAEQRSRSRLFAGLLAAAVAFCYWPISFLAYLGCTAALDHRQTPVSAA